MPQARLNEHPAAQRRSLDNLDNEASGEADGHSVNGGSSGAGGTTAATSTTSDDDGLPSDPKLLLEKRRQLGCADVDLACPSECGDGLSDRDDITGIGNEGGDGYNTAAKEASSGTSPKTTPPNGPASNKRSHARASKNQAYFTTPDKTPARRFRRKPDEMYEEWETSAGRYSVAYSQAQVNGATSPASLKVRVLALSNPKIAESAHSMYPGGPRVCSLGEFLGNIMGVLFFPPNTGLTQERTADGYLMFYVVSGKVSVHMLLDGCGGKTARFSVNRGGAWEVPSETKYAVANGLAMAAQVVFWRCRAEAGSGNGGRQN